MKIHILMLMLTLYFFGSTGFSYQKLMSLKLQI